MRIALATAVTMIAFASNSILTRMAIDCGHIDPSAFAIVRVASGALVLGVLVGLRRSKLPVSGTDRWVGVISLAVYLVGFTLAYLTLDAGLGALILFGVVQISIFAFNAFTGSPPSARQVLGGAIAFFGLIIALWPGPGGVADPVGAGLMVLAGVGWAAYTIAGRGAQDPLAATAANFLFCVPIMLVVLGWSSETFSMTGVALGVLCGGLTSGLGYALWYAVLPKLDGSTAAVVQLSVPVIAILAGALILAEAVSLSVILATVLVIGGIGLSIKAQPAQKSET